MGASQARPVSLALDSRTVQEHLTDRDDPRAQRAPEPRHPDVVAEQAPGDRLAVDRGSPAPASISTLTMSSVGTRGAGPEANVGAPRSDHSTSMRRPLAMTVSPTVEPVSGVDRNVARMGRRSVSLASSSVAPAGQPAP